MLMLQSNGTNKMTLLIYDIDTGEKATVAVGAELKGFSWSPDQRRIAYGLKEPGATVSSLYVYDILTGKADQIAVDYIHGDEVAAQLGAQRGNMGFLLPTMNKHDLFKTVILDGVLPRKTFSMGEAHEKRFYLECRKITK